MPRVHASMADVSTDFSPIEPGVHRYEIEEVTEHKDEQTDRIHYALKCKVVEVIEGGDEKDVGRSYTDRIHIHTRQGELNEIGLANLKRYFEVTVGEEQANDPDADTDWLIGQQFLGQTGIQTYTVTDNLTGQEETRKRNEISRLAPI